ncbi:hypothetical protein [Actinomadura sp. 9N215]|uniref:hypothetical protein n=1 Tax=Actinomadura sp. 9N215 TaxID=3375150 RepID=UPI00378DB2B2
MTAFIRGNRIPASTTSMRGRTQPPDPTGAVLDQRQRIQPRSDRATASRKSRADSVSACERKKPAQALNARSERGIVDPPVWELIMFNE